MCNDWPDFPNVNHRATGGLIGNAVIICGGADGDVFDECYSLTSEKATLITHMSVGRLHAASIVVNENTLWVTGGYSGLSTEYVSVTGTLLGPDLPQALDGHAMVAINSTCSMVIGGWKFANLQIFSGPYTYASTFFYDRNEGEWVTGPSLMESRASHAAGIVTDEETDEEFVIVTGGYYYYGDNLDSTEILQDGEWVQGKINDTICYLCPKISNKSQLFFNVLVGSKLIRIIKKSGSWI